MLWYSPSPRQKNLDSGVETVCTHGLNTYFHHFKRLQSKSTTGISAAGREQRDQGLCWQQHLQQIHKGNIRKEVGNWKTQTLHLSSLVAAQKGQGCDPSDLKAQELRKGRDVTGFFFWALLMLKTLSSLLWKITWLLKVLLHCWATSRGKCLHSVSDSSAVGESSSCPSVIPQSINMGRKLVNSRNSQHQLSSPHSHTGWC